MDANFRRTVQQKIKNMGDKKVFTSPEFQEYASLLVHAVSKKPKSKLNITLSFDKKSDITAYTDGQKIFANLGHSLVQTYKTAGARFLAAMGMLFHECAHIRFYNNQEYTALIKKYAQGSFPIEPPKVNREQAEALAGIEVLLTTSVGKSAISQFINSLDNCVVDYHDEQCLFAEEGTYVHQCILTVTEAIRSQLSSLESMLAKDQNDLAIILNLILQYARWNTFIVEDSNNLDTEEHLCSVKAMAPYIDKAKTTDDPHERFRCYNYCLIHLWPYIKNLLNIPDMSNNAMPQESSGDGGSGGESNGSDAQPAEDQSGGDPSSASSPSNAGQQAGNGDQNTGAHDSESEKSGEHNESGEQSSSIQGENDAAEKQDSESVSSSDASEEQSSEPASSDDASAEQNTESSSTADDQAHEGLSQKEMAELADMLKRAIDSVAPADMEKLNEAVSDGTNNFTQTKRPNLPASSKSDASKQKSEMDKTSCNNEQQAEDEKQTAEEMAESAINSIARQIAEREASEEESQSIFSEQLIEISQIPAGSSHKGCKIFVQDCPVTKKEIDAYNATMKEVGNLSRSLQRKVQHEIMLRRDDCVKHHRIYGKKVAVGDTYRRDGRFFDRKKDPGNPIDVAIAVIIDRSGSMYCGNTVKVSSNRIQSAIKAAALVYDFAHGLKIPIMVVGHHTAFNERDSILYLNATFTPRKDDKYRIMDSRESGECNRDGLIINAVSELLSRRSEELKLLFVISDGQPNADHYSGAPAIKDIQNIVKHYKQKGVFTFATAIGEDKDKIKEIYGDGYIDISDLKTFPQRLVRMIANKII